MEITEATITFLYRNYKLEWSGRVVTPERIFYGSTEWHEKCWIMVGWDHDKQAERHFDLAQMFFVSKVDTVQPYRAMDVENGSSQHT
jgi:predicted DNA-binding transcriptional regulator YafY